MKRDVRQEDKSEKETVVTLDGGQDVKETRALEIRKKEMVP